MPSINLTLPIFNEETILERNTKEILDFISNNAPLNQFEWRVILADNGSTDKTAAIAQTIASQFPQVRHLYINKKGKGLAIKTAWQKFPADYYIFMDADLATDLEALPRLVKELESGADLVLGSRYLPASRTSRALSRIIISKIYLLLARFWLGLQFSDLACGFKGLNHQSITALIPRIKNNEWFFDTELVYRADKAGLKIKEIPIKWTETLNQKRKSRVGVIRVSWNYIKEMIKLKISPR